MARSSKLGAVQQHQLGVIATNIRTMPGPMALIASILHGTMLMQDAACRGQHQPFDIAAFTRDAAAVKRAIAICASCPERGPCAEWVAGLDDQSKQALGVAGGIAWIPVRETKQTTVATAQRAQGATKIAEGTGTTTRRPRSPQISSPRRLARIARQRARDAQRVAAS